VWKITLLASNPRFQRTSILSVVCPSTRKRKHNIFYLGLIGGIENWFGHTFSPIPLRFRESGPILEQGQKYIWELLS
jgi:hypothetical protein